MATDRFSPFPVVKAHLLALGKRKYGSTSVETRGYDWVALFALILIPALVGLAAWRLSWRLATVDALLEGSALLVGGLIAGFAQIAAWRDRLTAAEQKEGIAGVSKRDSLDESVAHTLMAVYAAVALTVLLAIDANVLASSSVNGETTPLNQLLSSLTLAASAYLTLLVLLVLANLWSAYSDNNDVPSRMGGVG